MNSYVHIYFAYSSRFFDALERFPFRGDETSVFWLRDRVKRLAGGSSDSDSVKGGKSLSSASSRLWILFLLDLAGPGGVV